MTYSTRRVFFFSINEYFTPITDNNLWKKVQKMSIRIVKKIYRITTRTSGMKPNLLPLNNHRSTTRQIHILCLQTTKNVIVHLIFGNCLVFERNSNYKGRNQFRFLKIARNRPPCSRRAPFVRPTRVHPCRKRCLLFFKQVPSLG